MRIHIHVQLLLCNTSHNSYILTYLVTYCESKNVELNLPHHLNYVAALPCKCTQGIVHVKLRVIKCAPVTFAVTLAIAVRF